MTCGPLHVLLATPKMVEAGKKTLPICVGVCRSSPHEVRVSVSHIQYLRIVQSNKSVSAQIAAVLL